MAIRIAWPDDEIELNADEIARKVKAYSAVADMSPEAFRRLIDGPSVPPRTGYISHPSPVAARAEITLHIPVPYATYPPRQLSFDFHRDPTLYRPYPGRK